MTTLEETLKIVEKYVNKRFSLVGGYREDFMQEAQISAWQDYEAGKSTKHICMRAGYRVINLMSINKLGVRGQHQWTGHLTSGRDHQKSSAGEIVREKIRLYLSEYRTLHERQPTQKEIAQAMGITRATVIQHMNRLYLFAGPELGEVIPLDTEYREQYREIDPVGDRVSFGLDAKSILQQVENPTHRQWLYLVTWEDKTHREVAEMYGVSTAAVSQAVKRVTSHLKEVMKS